ncbi:hypothetical protein BT67DRAFT_186285 [Trichocladium antarcticum]|uniref:Uncharacterized protein n=1 Tax=Trichocladium antarcticum TaxID=1450529 RepID=A0AAN6ZG63_9PEZI|nr:hypothetical protein BT67DRAFT_186285 [Trichocladium antarcticum]
MTPKTIVYVFESREASVHIVLPWPDILSDEVCRHQSGNPGSGWQKKPQPTPLLALLHFLCGELIPVPERSASALTEYTLLSLKNIIARHETGIHIRTRFLSSADCRSASHGTGSSQKDPACSRVFAMLVEGGGRQTGCTTEPVRVKCRSKSG